MHTDHPWMRSCRPNYTPPRHRAGTLKPARTLVTGSMQPLSRTDAEKGIGISFALLCLCVSIIFLKWQRLTRPVIRAHHLPPIDPGQLLRPPLAQRDQPLLADHPPELA